MKIIRETSRLLVGLMFIFSGIIKINDPIGTAIKLEEYFTVFSYDFASFFIWFTPFVLPLAVFLCVLEIVLGVALLLGYKMKITATVLLELIIFFTFLTFYSAYFNKVTDCGCFGDAIKLTPWESFNKDLILIFLIFIIYWQRKKFNSILNNKKTEHIIMGCATAFFLFISIYVIRHLPFIDFRPYAVGNNIPKLMQPSGQLKYKFIMEKDGNIFEFEKYPTDKSYIFKSMDVLNPEVLPKITDFAVWNNNGDYTEQLFEGEKLLIMIQPLKYSILKNNEDLKSLIVNLSDDIELVPITSASDEEYKAIANEIGIGERPFYLIDATVLKTMIRTSPGIILLKDGTVMKKWHSNDTPTADEVQKYLND